jgi:hypothetical protein
VKENVMSQMLEATRLAGLDVTRGIDGSDQRQVLMFCAIGLIVSLVALLVAPDWVFQPQDILQMP